MQVRMLTTLVWYGTEYHAGDIADLPNETAAAYLRTHQAERIDAEVETAAIQTGRIKGRRETAARR